jgi:hypothetical protein
MLMLMPSEIWAKEVAEVKTSPPDNRAAAKRRTGIVVFN